MELKPQIGIDNLRFGMTQAGIVEILGMANREKIDDDNDNLLLWEYHDPKIRLTFNKDEDNRLGYIRTINPNLTFNGHKILYSKVDFVKNEILGNIINDWEVEEYDFLTTYFNEEYWLTLHVEYGIVTSFEIGVPFKNDEEYDWPD
jgi:hypothetical protein